jgi:DNA-binding transcriptional regulator YiaG
MDYIDIIQEHRAEVAQAAGVSVQTLQGWTEGEGKPTMEQADKILEFLRHKG